MKKFVLTAALLLLTPCLALANVTVSKNLRMEIFSQTRMDVPAGKYTSRAVNVPPRSTIEIKAQILNKVFNDGSIFVCDGVNFRRFKNGNQASCQGMSHQKRELEFSTKIANPGQYFIIVDNTFSTVLTKKYIVSAAITSEMPPSFIHNMKQSLSQLSDLILSTFDVRPFDINVRSCNQINAFSETKSGSITLCSELLFDCVNKKNRGAFLGIMFHELGHSLLNLWGQPNYDNERTADEFATIMLLKSLGLQGVREYEAFFQGTDPWIQAQNAIRHGDTHPLNIQRIRNIENDLKQIPDFSGRWNNFLYPHMTEKGLQATILHPTQYDDPELARTTLSKMN